MCVNSIFRLAFLRWEVTQRPAQNTRNTSRREWGLLPRISQPSSGKLYGLTSESVLIWTVGTRSITNLLPVRNVGSVIKLTDSSLFIDIYFVYWLGGALVTSVSEGSGFNVTMYLCSFCFYDLVLTSSAFPDLEDNPSDTFLFVYLSSVPNRYTFTCPYCNCPNFDQDGLVEHCTSLHARDARQVVGNSFSVSTLQGAHILNVLCFIPGVSHLCLDALGGPWLQERRLFPALEDQAHILLRYLRRKWTQNTSFCFKSIRPHKQHPCLCRITLQMSTQWSRRLYSAPYWTIEVWRRRMHWRRMLVKRSCHYWTPVSQGTILVSTLKFIIQQMNNAIWLFSCILCSLNFWIMLCSCCDDLLCSPSRISSLDHLLNMC